VQQWLAWHGVDAQVRQVATEIDVGNALLSHAADLGADLIVMGAYGHARWTERVLGGATRTLLANMTVPVLMSH
jgi:nucleotide-binding universal stress UspA family protein